MLMRTDPRGGVGCRRTARPIRGPNRVAGHLAGAAAGAGTGAGAVQEAGTRQDREHASSARGRGAAPGPMRGDGRVVTRRWPSHRSGAIPVEPNSES
jgi:hypothetical protein